MPTRANTGFIVTMPSMVAKITGKNADSAPFAIFDSMPTPNIRKMIGRKMIFGVEPMALRYGSIARRKYGLAPSTMPSTVATSEPQTKPTATSAKVKPRS